MVRSIKMENADFESASKENRLLAMSQKATVPYML
jgi:hypothetical protein